ncbi:hypothetical protein IAQ61_000635, partial [Plenodomus lingam]|uniref:uncharacterized protein n=1 Tax=Leptosphaeria maculans TaxID=5022 RepID=UPI00331A0CB6
MANSWRLYQDFLSTANSHMQHPSTPIMQSYTKSHTRDIIKPRHSQKSKKKAPSPRPSPRISRAHFDTRSKPQTLATPTMRMSPFINNTATNSVLVWCQTCPRI